MNDLIINLMFYVWLGTFPLLAAIFAIKCSITLNNLVERLLEKYLDFVEVLGRRLMHVLPVLGFVTMYIVPTLSLMASVGYGTMKLIQYITM